MAVFSLVCQKVVLSVVQLQETVLSWLKMHHVYAVVSMLGLLGRFGVSARMTIGYQTVNVGNVRIRINDRHDSFLSKPYIFFRPVANIY
jgi:hypothetical protein